MLIDKPVGITSFDCIRRLRKKLGKVKMGHAGTLDPLASGLMLIGIGEGTKQLQSLLGKDKTYVADVVLGEKSTTGDSEGEIIEKKEVGNIDETEIRSVLASLVGEIELPVPAFSAIKRKGKPLYKYAREGRLDEVEIPIKKMRIDRIDLKEIDGNILVVEMDVGSGTYVRSIAEEIGRRLSLPARLNKLRRTRIGEFRVEDAELLP